MGSLREHNPSLWVETSPGTSWPTMSHDIEVDVAVVGGGITGLSVAAMLKRIGARVAVIEAGRIASGATGYTTAKVSSQHGVMYHDLRDAAGEEKARMYAEANEAAIGKVDQLINELGIECDFRRGDSYSYTTDASQTGQLQAEAEAAAALGLPASFTDTTELPFNVAAAVRFANQAMFHPRKYSLGLAASIPGDGSHLFENTRATDVKTEGRCEVVTDHGTVRAEHVVLATQIPFLDKGGFFARTHPERSYAMAVQVNGTVPDHMYLSVDSPKRSLRPHIEGDTTYLLVGGEGHKVGQDPDTRQRYQDLEDWARENFDVISIDYRWSAQDYMPVDDVPYIGPITSNDERILVATGFKKWGMTTGTVAGMMLTDAVQGRTSPWAPVFDSTRAEIRRSAKVFITENMNVAKRFVGDRLRTMSVPDIADLKPGEGGVVESDGDKVAAYRDDAGAMHAVSPTCTHMGCFVTWNTAERSWDCPCHGSRFSYDGDVFQGPAMTPLEKKPATDA